MLLNRIFGGLALCAALGGLHAEPLPPVATVETSAERLGALTVEGFVPGMRLPLDIADDRIRIDVATLEARAPAARRDAFAHILRALAAWDIQPKAGTLVFETRSGVAGLCERFSGAMDLTGRVLAIESTRRLPLAQEGCRGDVSVADYRQAYFARYGQPSAQCRRDDGAEIVGVYYWGIGQDAVAEDCRLHAEVDDRKYFKLAISVDKASDAGGFEVGARLYDGRLWKAWRR